MPTSSTARAPAKVNLFLEVTDKRPDGFHNIDSVFAELDLADTLTVTRADPPGVRLEVTGLSAGIPTDDRNLVHKAATRILERTGGGLSIRLEKRIPSGAGLGGGSSDAAAALRLANAGIPDVELREIGAELGSDVPFFFHGGVCVCRGRGEIVTPVEAPKQLPGVILVLTGIHCDTASAYRSLRLPGAGEARRSDDFLSALQTGDFEEMERLAFNRFEETVFAAKPDLHRLQQELTDLTNRPVRLSGSGGSLWLFGQNDDARLATAWASKNNVSLLPCRIAPPTSPATP